MAGMLSGGARLRTKYMRTIRLLTTISFIFFWCSTVVLANDLQKAAAGDKYSYEQIYISLPVYIISLLTTAGFVWTVAKYDNKRAAEIKKLQDQLSEAIKTTCKYPVGCDDCKYKNHCKILIAIAKVNN